MMGGDEGSGDMARKRAEQSGVMRDDADRLRARMERLGISDSELAREAGVHRDTIGAIKQGQGFRRSSLTKLEKALDGLEREAGLDAPAPAVESIEFEVHLSGESPATILVRGHGAEEAVARLLKRLNSERET